MRGRVGAARRGALVAIAVIGAITVSNASAGDREKPDKQLRKIDHIVVIYEENHSFDNLYGGWEGVNGRSKAKTVRTTQVDQNGVAYGCLKQNDVNLTSPPLPVTCTDAAHGITSAFPNTWFSIDTYIPATAKTCPAPLQSFAFPNGLLNGDPRALPGGCTRDLVHRFYQEIYQINGGRQNRYTNASDAMGLTMGTYDTKALPIYEYLHKRGHPNYVIADNFFQSAFGGSFLNHQTLIAAAPPVYSGLDPASTLHAIVDANGMPAAGPLYTPTGPVRNGAVTVLCPSPVAGLLCGDFAINTMLPQWQPTSTFAPKLPPQTQLTIGDRLNTARIDWAWYGGGWSNANGDIDAAGWTNGHGPACTDPNADPVVAAFPHCPNVVFQYHHQPFNFYSAFDPSTFSGLANRRAHLKDEEEFSQLADASRWDCRLKPVSFIKPFGTENEHPGYASEPNGSDHLVELLQAIEKSKCAKDTMVIVTYDEFGGQWDHVSPPGQGTTAHGPYDQWGPGSRIPALVLAPHLDDDFAVDSKSHDTTSILATIEHRFGLKPLSSRDAAVADLSSVFDAKEVDDHHGSKDDGH